MADARAKVVECAAHPKGDVGEAALWVAVDDHPSLDVNEWLDRLDTVGAVVREEVHGSTGVDVVPRFAQALRTTLNLRGAGGGTPAVHYLHTVLTRGSAIPLSASIVWMAVGRRAGLDVEGVALPGHFIIRIAGKLVDPFTDGDVLDAESAKRLSERVLGKELPALDPSWLGSASVGDILLEMSKRLRGCYASLGKWDLALNAAERCVLLDGEAPQARRDRGIILWQMGTSKGALDDLDYYMESAPEARDREDIARIISRLRHDG